MDEKKRNKADVLIKQYGEDIVLEAASYFQDKDRHCTIEQIEEVCKEIINQKI